MKRNLKKISVTLPPDLVDGLDYVSGRLGVSRSALIGQILPDSIEVLRGLLVDVPENPTPEDVIQFRGASAAEIRVRIEQVKGMADDLFAE
jgi:hypothetical protein